MCNYELRSEGSHSSELKPYTPLELAPALRDEIAALDTASKVRLSSAPRDPFGDGDYISMT